MSAPLEILTKYWGYSSFRPLQSEIIDSVLSGNDTLALLPTGGGKSICFQVPALAMEGICIVVSPLIALMKDQVYQLNRRGIAAKAIYSGMSSREIDLTLDNCIYGEVKFLYLSPERLKTELVLERAKKMNINLLAVDEAHCISQWGYDFRPPYLEIAQFKKEVEAKNLIALTATATNSVQKDIIEKLEFSNEQVFRKSFARKNLSYSVFQKENKEEKLLDILNKVPGSSVVYVKNRRRTQELSEKLRINGINADYYHAGLKNEARSRKQEDWIAGKTRVIVATNAFGMGIDKPDVRTVIHMDLPDSLENYYQEAGRAGRDENKAYAVLLYNQEDLALLDKHLNTSFPDIKLLSSCYQALANYYRLAVGSNYMETYDFELEDFASYANYKPFEAFNLLGKLADHGLIQLNEGFHQPSKIHFLINKTDLYKFEVANPNSESVLKAVLRLFGGEIFTDFVEIQETQVLKLIGGSREELERKLEYLEKNGVLKYVKQKNRPQLTFLTPRLDKNKLGIDNKRVELRKKAKTAQIDAMKHYTVSIRQCRTRLFQEYFGEEVYEDCGFCDYCLRRKRAQKADYGTVQEDILKHLSEGELGLDQLWKRLPSVQEDVYIEQVRILLDEGKIAYTDSGTIRSV